jgi:hypothetical protein
MRGAQPPGSPGPPPSFSRGILSGVGVGLWKETVEEGSRDGVGVGQSGRVEASSQANHSKNLTCMTPWAWAAYYAGRRRGPWRHTCINWAHVDTSAGLRSRGLGRYVVHMVPATKASSFLAWSHGVWRYKKGYFVKSFHEWVISCLSSRLGLIFVKNRQK